MVASQNLIKYQIQEQPKLKKVVKKLSSLNALIDHIDILEMLSEPKYNRKGKKQLLSQTKKHQESNKIKQY